MMNDFSRFKLNPQILNAVADAGYSVCTPIQEKAIPMILGGQDVIGIAPTGTGKTAAYVLPMLMQLKYAQGDTVRALILVPTRELAMQVEEAIRQFGKNTDLRMAVIYGGLGAKKQIETIRAGIDILVATPGRFLDIYLRGDLVTKQIRFLVLDEADKMMDMGFIGSIHRILEVIPRKRQNLLFSATMSDLVKKIVGDFSAFPITIEMMPQATPAHTVAQRLYEVPNFKTKINLLSYLLDKDDAISRLIIFTKTKVKAENIYKFIQRRYGENQVRVLHANKGQNTRINAINAFKSGEIRILVATDVAARGLDVSQVSHVINFDVPIVIEDYVHRIGRTGRAFHTGEAITFCTLAEQYYIEQIERLIRASIPREIIPSKVFVEDTPFEERQEQAKEIDLQKRKENPDFQGAFHEKKVVRKPNFNAKSQSSVRNRNKKPNLKK